MPARWSPRRCPQVELSNTAHDEHDDRPRSSPAPHTPPARLDEQEHNTGPTPPRPPPPSPPPPPPSPPPPRADQPGEQPGRAEVASRQADPDERGVELRAGRREPDVRGERQRQSAPGSGSVDRGDDRNPHAPDRQQRPGGPFLLVQHPQRAKARQLVGVGEVVARAERPARSREHDNPAVVFMIEVECQTLELAEHRVRHRVVPVGPVQGDDHDAGRWLVERDRLVLGVQALHRSLRTPDCLSLCPS